MPIMKKFALLILCVLLADTHLPGQARSGKAKPVDPKAFCKNDPRVAVRTFCDDLADLLGRVKAKPTITVTELGDVMNQLDLSNASAAVKFITAAAAMSKPAASAALQELGQGRLDQQLSSPANANGTTSLVSEAGSSTLLSLALDSGVLTRSVNGTTATLSTNGDQIFRLITGNDPDCTVTCTNSTWFENKVLSPINVYGTFDLAQRSNKTVPTTGQASGTTSTAVSSAAIPSGVGKLSGITARYEVLNRFDPRSQKFKDAWNSAITQNDALKADVQNIVAPTKPIVNILHANATPLETKKEDMLKAAKSDPSGKKLADFFANYFADASAKPLQDPTLRSQIVEVMKARALYRQAWLQALKQAVGTLFTFEYDYNRPASQPITHDFKLIYAYNFKTTGMVTFNGALSIYATVPPGANYGRTHYGQVSSEYDRTLSGTASSLQTQFSLAGYWQYQPSPSILNIPAGTVAPGTTIPLPNGTQEFVGTAGSLFVTQAKLTIKGSGGINVPIAVSWSNKTDLLQGSKVGGQVGISYNFSSVAGLFTGGGSGQ